MKKVICLLLITILTTACGQLNDGDNNNPVETNSYNIVHTGVTTSYDNSSSITPPTIGQDFYGQDAQYIKNTPSYTDNGDGTITDQVTGLMWQQDMGSKMTFAAASTAAANSTLGGHTDWRIPTIKELYSLIQFTGKEGIGDDQSTYILYIDTNYFNQPFGNTGSGERLIDAQTWSSTEYVSTTMGGDATVFGVNFIDGRIKGYPKYKPGTAIENTMYFRLVRNNTDYGKNAFTNNGDGTISDLATGLMWQQADDGNTYDWKSALAYAENLEFAGHSDWRLPSIKELQSIVDYTRSPDTTSSPAIDALFSCTPNGEPGIYGYYWSSTTHLTGATPGSAAAYIAFGEALGTANMDVHGAGAQRSDPKSGDINNYPQFFGPQGDVRYVYNYVRAVRNID